MIEECFTHRGAEPPLRYGAKGLQGARERKGEGGERVPEGGEEGGLGMGNAGGCQRSKEALSTWGGAEPSLRYGGTKGSCLPRGENKGGRRSGTRGRVGRRGGHGQSSGVSRIEGSFT